MTIALAVVLFDLQINFMNAVGILLTLIGGVSGSVFVFVFPFFRLDVSEMERADVGWVGFLGMVWVCGVCGEESEAACGEGIRSDVSGGTLWFGWGGG